MTVTIDIARFVTYAVVLVFAAVAIGIVLLIAGGIRNFFASRKYEIEDRKAMRKRWEEVERLSSAPGEMNRKMAILEADKLLDQALKSIAMPGETLGDRLKFASYKYPEIKEVWWAHKVRNQLAHEASFHLDTGIAKRAIREFKKALTRLGAI